MFSRYVALGDSTTEGLEDPYPDGSGYRGWADRLAERVAAVNPDLEYANLGVRGRKAHEVHEQQLEPALALKPDLATVIAGINDVLRRHCDLDVVAGHLDAMIGELRATGATVVTFTYPDPSQANKWAGSAGPRLRDFNERLRRSATTHGALVLDLEASPHAADPRVWHTDRLHANPLGHERVAAGLAHLLGLPDADAGWDSPLGPRRPVALPRALAADALWAARFLTPWIVRRLRGRSSGDGRLPKRPQLTRFSPPR